MRTIKKMGIITLLAINLCCFFALVFTACGNNGLSKPTGLYINESTMTLVWSEVNNADGYVVEVNGTQRRTTRTTYSLSGLSEGVYTIRVKAVGDGKTYRDSPWSDAKEFNKETENGLAFTLINSETEYEVTGLGTASGDVVVPEIFRGKPVTAIGASAFVGRAALTSIEIGGKVKTIGESAFTNCSYLTSVTIPESVTDIGAYAFQSCRYLDNIVIPDGVAVIQDYVFSYCRSLQTVSLGAGITKIGEYAFVECNNLNSVSVHPESSITSIEKDAFYNCGKLAGFTVPDTVTSIGEEAFYGCTNLENLQLSSNLISLDRYAFYNCDALKRVVISDSVTSIGDYAFFGCDELSDVTMGRGVVSIGYRAFNNTALYSRATDLVYVGNWIVYCKDIAEIKSIEWRTDTYGIADYVFMGGTFTSLTIPKSVKYIGYASFARCEQLVSVISEGLLSVGDSAFYNCKNLRSVQLNDGLLSIESRAFYGCTYLTGETIAVPESVNHVGVQVFDETNLFLNTLGIVYLNNWVVGVNISTSSFETIVNGTVGICDYAFYGNTVLRGITLPNGLKVIGEGAFYGCGSLMSVNIPDSVSVINDFTFYQCTNLGYNLEFTIPAGIVSIGRSAFYECVCISEIIIPDTVKTIGNFAFYNCNYDGDIGLHKVTLGNGVTHIGDYAFYGCAALEDIVIPDSVTSIGYRAFKNCTGLKSVIIGEWVAEINDEAFFGCSLLENIVIPDNVATIGFCAFRECSSLKSVKFGNSLSSIGVGAFYDCGSIESIVIPDNVIYIGDSAFRNCGNLTSVIIGSWTTDIGMHAFYGCRELTIYTSFENEGTGWNARWNTSYRPVIWGCELSADGTYVVSAKNSVSNYDAVNGICAPVREGYSFAGWMLSENGMAADYAANEIINAPDGATLYALWVNE